MTKIQVDVYTNRDAIQITFPARWIICPICDGNATTTRHIECDGGGFTASEFEEACHEDEDFADKYFGGFYDRPCPDCDGLGRVKIIDEDAVTGWRQRLLLKAYREQERDNRYIDAMQAAERRMGA
jgi:hypothetical protein